LARAVEGSHSTRQRWRQCGWLQARWHAHSNRWVAGADQTARQRLKPRSVLPTGEKSHNMWLDAQPSQPTASSHFATV